MCGYLIYKSKPTTTVLEDHLTRQRHRGMDGFGALHVASGKTCKALSFNAFAETFKRTMPREGTIIIHHRKASVGGISLDLVHPIHNKNNKHLIVMQNGTKRELVAVTGKQSDTVAIAELWPRLRGSDMEQDMLDGAGVVFIWNEGVLTLSHDGSRTLHHCIEGVSAGLISSEPLTEGVWQECPPLRDVVVMPTAFSDWPSFLPLSEPEEYVENKLYTHTLIGNETTKQKSATTKEASKSVTGNTANMRRTQHDAWYDEYDATGYGGRGMYSASGTYNGGYVSTAATKPVRKVAAHVPVIAPPPRRTGNNEKKPVDTAVKTGTVAETGTGGVYIVEENAIGRVSVGFRECAVDPSHYYCLVDDDGSVLVDLDTDLTNTSEDVRVLYRLFVDDLAGSVNPQENRFEILRELRDILVDDDIVTVNEVADIFHKELMYEAGRHDIVKDSRTIKIVSDAPKPVALETIALNKLVAARSGTGKYTPNDVIINKVRNELRSLVAVRDKHLNQTDQFALVEKALTTAFIASASNAPQVSRLPRNIAAV